MSTNKTKSVKNGKRRKYSYRRKNKNGTIRKVMRGCSSRQYGGATTPVGMTEVPQASGRAANSTAHANNVTLSKHLLAMGQLAGNKPDVHENHPIYNNFTAGSTTSANSSSAKMTGGSYKSRHRRLRYKKSIGRRGRSRRFRKTKRH